jgi:Family of unknown function (DUF5317)
VGLSLVFLVGAAALGRLAGGRFEALSELPIRGGRLVVIAVIAQLVGSGLARTTGLPGFYPVGLALSALAGLAFCVRNIRLAGVPLIALGLLLNALVVVANGTMPVSIGAAARAGVPLHEIASGDDPRHAIAGPDTTWPRLGDVIPVPLPLRPEVVSPGDLLVAAGLAELVLLGMRPRRRRSSPAPHRTAVTLPQPDEEISHGQEEAQAPRPGEEQGQPRQASEHLIGARPAIGAGWPARPPTHL